MRKTIQRVIVVGAAQLVLFEVLEQFAVHWRESTEEICSLVLWLALLVVSVWALLPGFSRIRPRLVKGLVCGVAALALFVALYAGTYFYSWHLRPNLGLYREPDWVGQHPGFQRELRNRIEANLWKPAKDTESRGERR